MEQAHTFLADLAMVTAVAAVTGMVARALKQPSILGYLLAGLIVGPYIPVPLFADPHRIESLAQFGVVLVMFSVGLEFRVHRLLQILPVSGFTALIQMGVLLWAGFSLGAVLGWTDLASVVLGATLAISSTMVVTGIFGQQPVDEDVREHVLGVLVVQDVAAIVLMAVVTAASQGLAVEPAALGLLAAKLGGVMLAMLVVGVLIVPRLMAVAWKQGSDEGLSVLAVAIAFVFAETAAWFGYSVALGAFIGGMVVAESGRGHEVEHNIGPLRALFAAIFFVSIGMTVDPLVAFESLPLALLLSAVVIAAQFVSVSVASVLSGSSLRRGLLSGLALGQIGELSFILASIGAMGGLVPESLLPTLVTVATITAFTTPLLLSRGTPLVAWVDRVTPDRVHHLISLYQALLQRSPSDAKGPTLRSTAIALVLDWLALVALGVLRLVVRPAVADTLNPVWVDLATVALAVPFLAGLFWTGRRLIRQVRERTRSAARSPEVAAALEQVVWIAVAMGISIPTLAVVRPLIHNNWADAIILIALVAIVIALGRRLGRVDGDITSAVQRFATRLAAAADRGDDAEADPPDLLSELAHQTITLQPDSPAVGQTLAQLDLRAQSGATVLAIQRGTDGLVLPTGHESLAADDILAISGSPDALIRARALLGSAVNPAAHHPMEPGPPLNGPTTSK